MTVPPSAVARIAPLLAAGHVDADDGDVGRAAGGRRRRRARRDRVAGVGDHHRVGQAGRRAAASRLAPRSGTTPMVRPAPARAGGGQATASRTCRRRRSTATVGARRWRRTRATTRAVSAGAPQTSITASARRGGEVVGQHGGDASGRTGSRGRRPGTCSRAAVPARQAVVDAQRGQRERDQGGDPVADARGRAGDSGPTSSTVPTSMPPEPVTGFCILPRRRRRSRAPRRARRRRRRRAVPRRAGGRTRRRG